jgi:hypothetical protein
MITVHRLYYILLSVAYFQLFFRGGNPKNFNSKMEQVLILERIYWFIENYKNSKLLSIDIKNCIDGLLISIFILK